MVKKKYSVEEIQSAILDIFTLQKDCAKALGLDETNMSNKIKRGSPKFIKQLKSVGVVFNSPIVKEKEVVGLSLAEQIELLKERNRAINIEFEKVKAQIILLKKDCGVKEGCLIKNMKLENETDS